MRTFLQIHLYSAPQGRDGATSKAGSVVGVYDRAGTPGPDSRLGFIEVIDGPGIEKLRLLLGPETEFPEGDETKEPVLTEKHAHRVLLSSDQWNTIRRTKMLALDWADIDARRRKADERFVE